MGLPVPFNNTIADEKGEDEVIENKKCAVLTLNENVKELEELAISAGYAVLFEIIQRRVRAETSTYVGSGKLEDLKAFLDRNRIDFLLINGIMKPSQHFNLENTLKVECVDKVRLVLNIFTERANSREAMLQVERARLQHEVPLLREWIHNAKMGEHPGFLGGGEYAVDVYYDVIRKRLNKIDDELTKISKTNLIRREHRRKKGFHLVSLAGYANAGKSSLEKALTGESVLIDSKMFSTLSTTTRSIENGPKDILITDTIGFFHGLPHFVIEAFKNTIDEIFSADLILLVVDGSDSKEEIIRKLRTSEDILYPEVSADDVLIVLNKIDRCPYFQNVARTIEENIPSSGVIAVSAVTGVGISDLRERILSRFKKLARFAAILPQSSETERFIASLRLECEISSVEYSEKVKVKGSCNPWDAGRIAYETELIKGEIDFNVD